MAINPSRTAGPRTRRLPSGTELWLLGPKANLPGRVHAWKRSQATSTCSQVWGTLTGFSVHEAPPPHSQAWQRSRPGSVHGVAAEGGLTEMEARRLAQGVAQRAARNPGSHSCRAAEGTPSPPVSRLPLKVLVHAIAGPALKPTLGE